jgi:hypothetical protein
VPGLAEPTLLDPAMLGVLYAATGRVLVDPYTGMKKNLVDVRVEIHLLCHIRNVFGSHVPSAS